ncbi:MAG: hypothetical protein R3A10_03475 [Caldilineaceae bacterium]
MSVFDWIEMATMLPAEGLEMGEGFLWQLDDAYADSVAAAIQDAGFAMPMMLLARLHQSGCGRTQARSWSMKPR